MGHRRRGRKQTWPGRAVARKRGHARRGPLPISGAHPRAGRRAVAALLLVPALVALVMAAGPFTTDATALYSGIALRVRPGWLPGAGTIDPNMGLTAYALGRRAALDLLAGQLPLWNHFEGLGAPLLGEMQSAALFPPTLLLLLPHGQMIEQAALQAVAGLGMYLFLRRFGLGVTAALAGGLLFELNGVFAWLRNAIFNPVPFLPWLAYAIELLRAAARERDGTLLRRGIGVGALAAALATYAGFPEVVYFYSLLLLAWAAVRAPRRALPYVGGLVATAALGAALAAPGLFAFWHFLGEAEVGGHQLDLFRAATLPAEALPVHLLPYLYGPIAASPVPVVATVWGAIGGYVGVVPVVLAIAGLIAAWRRSEAWVLAAWVVVAVGASHGLPGIHAAFLRLPLVSIAGYERYLDASVIFACATLAAAFIDAAGTLRHRRSVAAAAVMLVAVAIAAALVPAWPILSAHWAGHRLRVFAGLSLGAAAALLVATAAAAWRTRPAAPLAALLAGEALVAFLLPIASFPRVDTVDRGLIPALAGRPGRYAIASGPALSPNFGSAFGIPSLNYDDLPIPARTVAFALARIDPGASVVNFHPPPPEPGQRAEARRRVLAHLDGYRAAGVATLLAEADFFAIPIVPAGPPGVAVLHGGETLSASLGASPATAAITALLLRVGTYGGLADGRLDATLCAGDICASGITALRGAVDNAFIHLKLAAPLPAGPLPLRLSLAAVGGTHEVAIWTRGAPEAALATGADPPALASFPAATLFAVPDPAPYAAAPDCRVAADGFDRMALECDRPSRLTRREVAMSGWTAELDGRATPIRLADDTFQAIDVPAGRSTVTFRYDPPLVRASVPVALLALAAAARLAWPVGRARRRPTP